jgi:hypothetical protein
MILPSHQIEIFALHNFSARHAFGWRCRLAEKSLQAISIIG